MGVIYKIISPSGKVYVGKTYDLRKRINAHKARVNKGSSIILHNSIRKYGWDAHKLEVIEEVADELLNELEIYWISELKTYCYENPMGLNMTKGGDGQRSTWIHDEKRRKIQSERFSKQGNPFYGKTHTEENRKAQSQRAKEWAIKNKNKIPAWGVEKGRLKVMRSVLCYDKHGVFLKEYDSLTTASKEFGITHASISESCTGAITGVLGKYVFRYKTENYSIKIDVGDIKHKTERRPVILMNEDFEPIIEFPSALEASEFLGVPKTTINRAAQYNFGNPTRLGHVFMYREMYDEVFAD